VVEDDAVTRKVISRYLSDGGMVVTTAGDGIEALIQIGHQQFDLIVSDIQMPNLDGLRLQELLRVKGINTPVILVTGSESEEDELAALNMGAADYIRKPIRREVLVARVKRAIGRRLAA
jgi:two-component system response regulator AtoC